MTTPKPIWYDQRHRAIHMTIRDVDCRDFDVAQMIETFEAWRVTLFSFFAGGYVTTYPTQLSWQRISPYLDGRDLCGEIIESAHKAGMIAFPMIDLGMIPLDVAEANPGWSARNADGSILLKTDGIASSCPLGDYVRTCSQELVAELLDRYPIDGIKFGGASYAFPSTVCYCDSCRATYRADTEQDLPHGPDAMLDPQYRQWREDKVRETARHLIHMVRRQADIPVVGNNVWYLGRGLSIDDIAREQDFIQMEVQTRSHPSTEDKPANWERFAFPTETCRYVSHLTERPPWVVASYFLAWPWRRIAVPYPEQKLYLAQIAANGCSPMVNLSGGPPKVHEDPRGFRAIAELFNFMADHEDLYAGDRSAANVAIVYCHQTAAWANSLPNSYEHYLADLHGCQDALNRAHIPFDIIPTDALDGLDSERYTALLLPSATALSAAAAQQIERLTASGVGLVATGAPGLHDHQGRRQARLRLADLLGVREVTDASPVTEGPHQGWGQAYGKVTERHPLFDDIDIDLLPLGGFWHPVTATEDADVLLRRAAPFRLFPEGLSYADYPDPDEPLAIAHEPAGRVLYLPFAAGRCALRTGHPDNMTLIANALRWAARTPFTVELPGHEDVLLSLRRTERRLLIHLVNTTGRYRYLNAFTPVRDLEISLVGEKAPKRIWLAGSGVDLPWSQKNGAIHCRVPELVDYDIVIVEG